MTSLIEEIQRDALNDDVPVSRLLRKVQLAAAKLNLDTVEAWVSDELKGYEKSVPAYRLMQGTVRYNNGYTGWQELLGDTSSFAKRGNGQSVSQIEAMINADTNSLFALPYTGEAARLISKAVGGGQASYALFIDRPQLVGVLSAVRDLILDWAIKLEKAGIKGDGMSFSENEKKLAEHPPTSINIGSINSVVGGIGVGNTVGSINVGAVSIDGARSLVKQLRENSTPLAAAANDGAVFEARLSEVEAELLRDKPNAGVVTSLLTDLRNTLSGAAGNLIASGAVNVLNQMLGTGVPT